MIPAITGFLKQDFEVGQQPDKTYRINPDAETIKGYADGLEAVKQAHLKMINTERYAYPIYSWDYGIELMDLYGQPVSYVCAELERRITEASIFDERVKGASDFQFKVKGRSITVFYTIHTIYGDFEAEKEVEAAHV